MSWPLSWQGSDVPLIYSIGVVGITPLIAMSVYLCLAFSTGRLQNGANGKLLAALVFVLALFFGASLLLSPVLVGEGRPLATCPAACPHNPFQVGSAPGLLEGVAKFVTYVGLAIVAVIAAVWLRRFRAATRPQRRTLVPVAATSALLVPSLFVFYFSVLVIGVGEGAYDALSWLLVGMWIVFPVGFAIALLQADLFAGQVFRRLLSELANRPTPAGWHAIVADALDDPSLRLGYWDPAAEHFRDAEGGELARTLQVPGRQWTEVRRDGLPVAALDTDDALAENPELVDAAATATLLAVETGRLEGQLRRSQARALAAADAERRRIGRDLHDTAQQRLLALRVHLSLAGEQLQPEEQPIVEELERELDEALDELQSIARGIYPQVLAEYGVAAALRSAVQRAAIPISVTDEGLRRHSSAVELAVYFCCLEALQNVAKHAGRGHPRASGCSTATASCSSASRTTGWGSSRRGSIPGRASRTWPTGFRPSAGRSGLTRAPAAAPASRDTSPSEGASGRGFVRFRSPGQRGDTESEHHREQEHDLPAVCLRRRPPPHEQHQRERRDAVGDLRTLEPRREAAPNRCRSRPGTDEPDADQEHEPDADEVRAPSRRSAVRISHVSLAAGRTESDFTRLSTR